MRFNGHRYIECRWCGGKGCLACEAEADAAYRRAFPDGPKPIATFKLDDPGDMARMKAILSADALKQTFGPDGGGIDEICEKLRATEPKSTA